MKTITISNWYDLQTDKTKNIKKELLQNGFLTNESELMLRLEDETTIYDDGTRVTEKRNLELFIERFGYLFDIIKIKQLIAQEKSFYQIEVQKKKFTEKENYFKKLITLLDERVTEELQKNYSQKIGLVHTKLIDYLKKYNNINIYIDSYNTSFETVSLERVLTEKEISELNSYLVE